MYIITKKIDADIIAALITAIKNPMYKNEEIILYYNVATDKYTIAKSATDRLEYEQSKNIDILTINPNGFFYVYTQNISIISRHYGQSLLTLIKSTKNNYIIANEAITIIDNAIFSVNQSLKPLKP